MTYAEFERKFCEWAGKDGWWALNIPRSKAGQQPFDVIACKGSCVLAVDCKLVSAKKNLFPLDRIEDNQWMAFSSILSKSNNVLCLVFVKTDCTYIRNQSFFSESEHFFGCVGNFKKRACCFVYSLIRGLRTEYNRNQ